MDELRKPSYQPTSSPTGLWVAPSIPSDIDSSLTFAPTNNEGLIPILPKDVLRKDDENTMEFSKILFIGVVLVVFAIVAIYAHRRYVALPCFAVPRISL